MVAIESTLLMGAVLLGIVVVIGLIRDWERTPSTGENQMSSFVGLFKRPATWTVLFVGIVALFGVGALAYVDGSNALGLGPAMGELILVAGGVLLLTVFIYGGLYTGYRNRGLKEAQAAGISSILLGGLFILVIGAVLLTG